MSILPTERGLEPAGATASGRRRGWLVDQLPVGLTDDDFFRRFVSMFEAVADTVLDGADTLEHLLDPTVTPLPMARYLTRWLGMPVIDPDLPEALQRRVLRGAGATVQHRGTAEGLAAFLLLLTGSEPRISDSGGVYPAGEAPHDPGHVRIEVDETGEWLRDDHLLDLIRDEIPAHVSFELVVAGRTVWPAPEPETPQEQPDD